MTYIQKIGVVAFAVILSVAMIAPFAVRAEDEGYSGGGYDGGYSGGGYDGGYSGGGYDGGYSGGGYDGGYSGGGYDGGYSGGGYDGGYSGGGYDTPQTNWYDTADAYTPQTNWYDTADAYTPQTNWYDTADAYTPADQWDAYDVYDTYDTYDTYDQYDYTYQDGVAYSERSYDSSGQSYSTPSQSYSQPFSQQSFGRAPSSSYAPSYPSYPTPQPQPQPQRPITYPVQQQQQQQQQQQGGGSQPINIVNTNNNNNVNTNTNTAPVVPVYQTPITYPIQYVYPQQPVYPTQNAYCVITASPTTISNGQASYLTWSSTGATSAWLSDSIGAVAVNGSLAVRPNSSKTYTLTVTGSGGTVTCNTYVTVQGTYISLSQIPYTGFDAGLLGNAMYWLSLISFAVAGAYLVVYYKGGALALAGQVMGSRQAVMHEVPVQTPVETNVEGIETPVETMTPSPIQIDAMENLPVAPMAKATMDSMQVMHSKEGGAPRIVITRS